VAAEGWKLKISGLVQKPVDLSLDQIKSRPKQQVIATLECSGNGSNPGFMGAIGNAKWTGTPLAPLLKESGVSSDAIEVAFWGADKGKEKIRGADYEQNFARCLSISDAMREDILLAYEMNGEPLSTGHGFPLRLIVPGWYGIAWVKWLMNIELRDRRLMNRFMARDYVTVRGIPHGDQTEWKESSVGPMNGKSIVARVVKRTDGNLVISGAAWTDGTPLKSVELKIDDGPWIATDLDTRQHATHAWTFWSYNWKDAAAGEHTLVSRAIDAKGRMQPTADDPQIKLKKTYWEAYAQYPRHIRI
jgi:DMSO/TMAO reductase YedYZ molybdopterin-dependent catalytic subunit